MESHEAPEGKAGAEHEAYGTDDPFTILMLGAVGAAAVSLGAAGVLLRIAIGPVPALLFLLAGLIVGFVSMLFAVSLYWSSRSWKPGELTRLSDSLPWGGDEVVLDIGCGRGLFSVTVARELSRGAVVALDLWKRGDLSGNDPESLLANARLRGVSSKVMPIRADPRALPFIDGAFDTVVSGLAINKLHGKEGRRSALREAVRVLKGGGRMALLIAGSGRDSSAALRDEPVRDLEVSAFRLGLFPPAYSVAARKSFGRPAARAA